MKMYNMFLQEIEKLERDVGELMEQLDESETANQRLRRDLQSVSEGSYQSGL